MVSLIELQAKAIIDAIQNIQPQNTWRYVVTDETSFKIIKNVMDIHQILDHQVTAVQELEHKRPPNPKFEAVYFLSPDEYVLRCFISDFDRPVTRYACAHIQWTSDPGEVMQGMLRNSPAWRYIAGQSVLSIDFFPRESHLFTFREPSSFFSLYHPDCRSVVRNHMVELARKILCVCIELGENPTIRYFRPMNVQHEAKVLSELLARAVQDELDRYAKSHPAFPPQSNRPKGVLFIVDRSIDLYAPVLHEFTYQAMAHDLLPIKENDQVTYSMEVTEQNGTEMKDMVISENDKIWVDVRHQHMKDTIEKLMSDFQGFLRDNKNFVDTTAAVSLNAIKDMLANLPQFQEMKEAYSLHLSMAQECMSLFEKKKLPDTASVEQTLATGLNENYQAPRNVADQLVRLLDDSAIGHPERLRLIIMYLLFKDGLLEGDLQKLIFHAHLGRAEETICRNLDILGARVIKPLGDKTPNRNHAQLKKAKNNNNDTEEEYELSRFVTAVQSMLEDHVKGTLDPTIFPFVKAEFAQAALGGQESSSQASLRSARPTWAKTRLSVVEPKQRVIVFMAGGATYSESRACYEVAKSSTRDIFLGSSHMITPMSWLHQLSLVRDSRRNLDLPYDRPQKAVPKQLLEADPVPKPPPPPVQQAPPKVVQRPPPQQQMQPPTKEMGGLKVNYNPPGGGRYAPEEKKKKKFGLF
ncbi:Sec1 family protein [Peziza echinospora]|nr:Sec1 family protein [Peziza echinospora]